MAGPDVLSGGADAPPRSRRWLVTGVVLALVIGVPALVHSARHRTQDAVAAPTAGTSPAVVVGRRGQPLGVRAGLRVRHPDPARVRLPGVPPGRCWTPAGRRLSLHVTGRTTTGLDVTMRVTPDDHVLLVAGDIVQVSDRRRRHRATAAPAAGSRRRLRPSGRRARLRALLDAATTLVTALDPATGELRPLRRPAAVHRRRPAAGPGPTGTCSGSPRSARPAGRPRSARTAAGPGGRSRSRRAWCSPTRSCSPPSPAAARTWSAGGPTTAGRTADRRAGRELAPAHPGAGPGRGVLGGGGRARPARRGRRRAGLAAAAGRAVRRAARRARLPGRRRPRAGAAGPAVDARHGAALVRRRARPGGRSRSADESRGALVSGEDQGHRGRRPP